MRLRELVLPPIPRIAGAAFRSPQRRTPGRHHREEAQRRGSGTGVSDLLLLYPSGKYHALCVEMKTPKGRQSEVQKAWQRAVERAGYKYALCRSLDDFITTIEKYLAL